MAGGAMGAVVEVAVVDLTERLRRKHVPKLVPHPSGNLNGSGLPAVRVCATCGTPWPCATARFLNDNR